MPPYLCMHVGHCDKRCAIMMVHVAGPYVQVRDMIWEEPVFKYQGIIGQKPNAKMTIILVLKVTPNIA